MKRLWLYAALSRLPVLSYRAKIMLMAFIGTHIPLLALIGLFVSWAAPSTAQALTVIGVALLATLAGTAGTLLVLNHLMRPVLITSSSLRQYGATGELPDLPTHFGDEVGTLMADASHIVHKLDATLQELANFDAVTGLPNRDHLLRTLTAVLAEGDAAFTLVVLCLTNHERIVGAFGQETADVALRVLARRLTDALPGARTLARVDARALAVVIEGQEEPSVTAHLFQRALAQTTSEIVVEQAHLLPEMAVGIALSGSDGQDATTLLNNAMTAVTSGRGLLAGQVTFFSPKTREAAHRRFVMEQELRRALSQNELILHYQPVVDLNRRAVIGAEALVRWRHPERGVVPPGTFIPVAEACGLIDHIGLWVFQTACGEARKWCQQLDRKLKIAVNLSA